MTARKRFDETFEPAPGRVYRLRRAGPCDVDAIRDLYDAVYTSAYPLKVIRDPVQTRAALEDPAVFWIAIESDGRMAGCVVFQIEATDRIGKVFGAVVRPEHRGHDLTARAIRAGMADLVAEHRPLDVVYATTRTLSPAPARLLASLGFVTCGVFPNVHKVARSETHGLEIYFRPGALASRLPSPRLVPELVPFFEIARRTLGLEDRAVVENVTAPTPAHILDPFVEVRDEEQVRLLYERRLRDRELKLCFFPFHAPHVLLHTPGQAHEVYLHHNPHDQYSCLLGIKGEGTDLGAALAGVCHEAVRLGLTYIEVLTSAFDPLKQRQALDAGFLPCAYFPAFKVYPGGQRMDYVVLARSFERLDFTQIHLDGVAQDYLKAFMDGWYRLLRVSHARTWAEDRPGRKRRG